MKKFIINSSIILILVLVTLSFTDPFFKQNTQSSYTNGVYEQVKGNVEIAIFGSSHAYSTYNPKVFDSITGLYTFNFGASAQRLRATEPVIDMVLNNENIKLAIVDIFSMSLETVLNENPKNLQYETFDNLGLSWSKVKGFISIYGVKNIPNMFPTIRNHNAWKEPNFNKEYIINKKYFHNGFYTSNNTFNDEVFNKYKKEQDNYNKKSKKNLKNLSNVEKAIIDDIICKFKESDIPLIFCSAPSFNINFSDKYLLYQDLIAKYLKSINIPFLDYNNYWDELSLSKEDFKDPTHLNNRGAKKVSTHFANIIEKKILLNFDLDKLDFKEKNISKFNEILYQAKSKSYRLNDLISISSYNVIKKKNGFDIKIVFDSSTSKKELKKYRLGVHIYPEESFKNLISDRSKQKGNDFDLHNVLLEETKENEILLQINTQIKEFEKIKLFLYNKDKYQGVIGQPIWVTNL